jgi:hypothetical protein
MAMAGPGQEPFGPSCAGAASPMGPKAPLSHGSLSPWGCPRGLGVLNCDLARQEPALLQIFFRIGPVWGTAVSQVSSLLALMALIGFAVVEVATRVFT